MNNDFNTLATRSKLRLIFGISAKVIIIPMIEFP